MRAAYYEKLGTAADVLTVGEVETPEPAPGEIRLRMQVSGVNPSDTMAVVAACLFPLSFPTAMARV